MGKALPDADPFPGRNTPEGIKIDGRFVPFPQSISPQARAALAQPVGPDGHLQPKPPSPPPDDQAAWAKSRADHERMIVGRSAPALEKTTAGVTTQQIAGVTVHVGYPAGGKPGEGQRAYIDIHGGAFVYGGGEAARADSQLLAERHEVTVYGVDYRMPPEHPYPAPLDDCLAVYRAVLERHSPSDVIVGGTSAGGNLAAALMLRARDEGLPPPAALLLQTPELDLTETGDSFQVNRYVDVVLQGSLADTIALYAAGADLADPYLSPLFGDFRRGFPPTLLNAGTRDLFLSNAARMHRALRSAGVAADLHVFEGMPHGGFGGAPEDADLMAEADRFVAGYWGRSNTWQ